MSLIKDMARHCKGLVAGDLLQILLNIQTRRKATYTEGDYIQMKPEDFFAEAENLRLERGLTEEVKRRELGFDRGLNSSNS
jgi:cell division protein FtsB